MSEPVKNPAPYSNAVLVQLSAIFLLEADRRGEIKVLDPMAGSGRIHEIADESIYTFGIELEPEWASQHPNTKVGDAAHLPYASGLFDVTCTSPDYGNRMADHHDAKDRKKDPVTGERTEALTRRITYKHYLGRNLSPESAISQWGPAYRALHRPILAEMVRVTKPGGLVIINVSNHIRGKEVQRVTEWYVDTLLRLRLFIEEVRRVPTPRMKFGANRDARVPFESIVVTRKAQ